MDTVKSSIEYGLVFFPYFKLMSTIQNKKYTSQQSHLCLGIAYFPTVLTPANKTFSGQVTRQKKQK